MVNLLNDISRLKRLLNLVEKQLNSTFFKIPSLDEEKARLQVMHDQITQMIVVKEKEIADFEKECGDINEYEKNCGESNENAQK
jgi:hypothetical protein